MKSCQEEAPCWGLRWPFVVIWVLATLLLSGRCLLDLNTPAEEQTGIQEDICKLLSLASISHSSSRTVAQWGKMDPARCCSRHDEQIIYSVWMETLERERAKEKVLFLVPTSFLSSTTSQFPGGHKKGDTAAF